MSLDPGTSDVQLGITLVDDGARALGVGRVVASVPGTGKQEQKDYGSVVEAVDGSTILYDNRLDGGMSEAVVTRVLRPGTGGVQTEQGWAVEAVTTGNSLNPNHLIVLTQQRAGGRIEVAAGGRMGRDPGGGTPLGTGDTVNTPADPALGMGRHPGTPEAMPGVKLAEERAPSTGTRSGSATGRCLSRRSGSASSLTGPRRACRSRPTCSPTRRTTARPRWR